jgi:SAM-dependent methyltransferase
MSRGFTPIDQKVFSAAQAAELSNWQSRAADPVHIRHELDEHSEIEHPLRGVCGSDVFERGLEVGIGPYSLGFLAVHFADKIREIDGLDPLPRLDIRIGDEPLQTRIDGIRRRVNYIQAQAESIPSKTTSYDIVSCINVVDHAQNPDRILKEIDRILRPGGLFVFGVSTLSMLGRLRWRFSAWLRPDTWLFVAHPHTFQWAEANALVETIRGTPLWNNRPDLITGRIGHGRMSFWIHRKAG